MDYDRVVFQGLYYMVVFRGFTIEFFFRVFSFEVGDFAQLHLQEWRGIAKNLIGPSIARSHRSISHLCKLYTYSIFLP